MATSKKRKRRNSNDPLYGMVRFGTDLTASVARKMVQAMMREGKMPEEIQRYNQAKWDMIDRYYYKDETRYILDEEQLRQAIEKIKEDARREATQAFIDGLRFQDINIKL